VIPTRSRRAKIGRVAAHLQGLKEKPRKAYTGDTPIRGCEWKRARERFRYTQAEFAAVLDVHWNTVARRERDEAVFAHPALARLAIEQHAEDLRVGHHESTEHVPISGAEWRVYREGLGMSSTEFGQALDAHVSTISDWEGDVAVFQHGNMARLAVRRLYALKGIPFPAVKIKRVRVLC
jgi:DNA-binding transcriptional regulator YiaG